MFIISSVCLCRWFSHHTHLSPQNVGYLSFLNQSDTQLLPSLIVLLKLTPACSLSDGSFFLTDDSTPRWRTGDALCPVQWKPLLRAASNRPLSPLHHKTHVCVCEPQGPHCCPCAVLALESISLRFSRS